ANANHRAGSGRRPWQQVTLRNKSGMTVTVADWGRDAAQRRGAAGRWQPAPTAAGLLTQTTALAPDAGHGSR
ncbi:hypothetical protein G7B13_29680, partial [Klebsiella pneumoniae]|nr:hypothetical protein [Klebsiella pneumoniae]